MNALLFVALAIGQDYPVVKDDFPMVKLTYADAVAKAVRENKQLIVFLDCKIRPVPGDAVVVGVLELVGVKGPAILVGRPNGKGWLEWVGTYPPDSEFRAREAVSPQAVPFEQPAARPIADGKPNARQLPTWFPKEAQRYLPAKYTQQVFNRNVTQPVHRSNLESKWNVPGGLENVTGWRSDLYRFVPSVPRVWRGDIEVWAGNYWQWGNGATVRNDDGTPKKSYQTETAWQRSYPVGSWFADVLSTNGNIFEVRVREKLESGWDSYVAFRDARHRPSGYSGLSSRSCNECHKQAGSGGYAVGWVPGGDGVLSDPFEGLKQ